VEEKGYIKSENIHGINKLSIFLLILVGLNPDWNSIRVLWWGVVALSSATMLFVFLKKSIPVNNLFIVWMFSFLLWSTVSYFWSLVPNFAYDSIKALLINLAALGLISSIIQTEKDIIQLLRLIVYAIAINAFYILFHLDFSLIGEVQIGAELLGGRWNGNTIGIMMSLSSLISLVLIKFEAKRHNKSVYILSIILTTIIALFTGSRKAVFFILFGFTMYTMMKSKKNKIINFIKASIILLVAYQAIMNIPGLYKVLGIRLEGLISNFTGKGTVDHSTVLRMEYIEYGIEWFKSNPIFGYGINNYRVLLGKEIGTVTYSHNNYIELLVGVGIIGIIIYYSGYLYVLINISKSAFKKKDPLFILLFIMLIAVLIAQYGFVTYYDFLINLILCIGFTTIRIRGTGNYEVKKK
jgi:O-antigen ligase